MSTRPNLTRAQRAGSGDERRKRLHQFLSDIGVKALRQHLGQLLGIAQVDVEIETALRQNCKLRFYLSSDPGVPRLSQRSVAN